MEAEEEEDRVLLSTLGVTSANHEDIERDILEKVTSLNNLRFLVKMRYMYLDVS